MIKKAPKIILTIALFFCISLSPAFADKAYAVTIKGKVVDAKTGDGINGATVTAYNAKEKELASDKTDSDGKYKLEFNIKKKISAALFRELFCVSEWSHDPMASHPRRRVPGDDECAGEGAVVCESGGAGDYYFNS